MKYRLGIPGLGLRTIGRVCAGVLICGSVFGQVNKGAADSVRIIQQDVITQLFGASGDLKSESDKPSAGLLLSEIADVLWKFDEPAARSMFRLAFDTARQLPVKNGSVLSDEGRQASLREARARASAIRTILKRYGAHDRKGSELWIQELDSEIKSEQTKSNSNFRISPEQAEFLADMAAGLASQQPREAQRLGLASLSGENIPSGFGRLLMALRDRDKELSDVLLRQALVSLRRMGFIYDPALVSMTNYQFSSNGNVFPDVSAADVNNSILYFVDAASSQLARLQSGGIRSDSEQASIASFYSFFRNRVLPIIARNAPDRLTLVQSNITELGTRLSADQRQQADMLASVGQTGSQPFTQGDLDLDSSIKEAERERNSTTRDFLFRKLALQLMRRDAEAALKLVPKIDNQQLRMQTEDEVLLVLLQKAFATRSYDEAKDFALKFNDRLSQARWLTKIAAKLSRPSPDQSEAPNLLSRAYSIASKADNGPAKVEVLLLIAKEYAAQDQERGFEILSEALNTANRVEKTVPQTQKPPTPSLRIITVTMIDGQEVIGQENTTIDSIDFNQIGTFAERDVLRTSILGNTLKDRLLKTKYLISLARNVLRVPKQGAGYERTLEDILPN
ncbi:MAG TPA: hypothetical protein VJ306_18645 [Pyrinomonadaceae bacterium]|nr:hypothetical protein [Pyrinomonadaceae bacterium]